MKLEFEERGTKDYYDEFFYIMNYIMKIKKNPKTKVKKLTTVAYLYIIFCIAFISIFIPLYIINKSIVDLIVLIILIVCLTLSIIYLILITNNIKKYKNAKGTNIFEIDDKNITVTNNDGKNSIKWDGVEYVVINKNTIVFVPINIPSILIGVDASHKMEVVKALKKYKKDKLLIDNSNLYE